jgi:hypothetical protein
MQVKESSPDLCCYNTCTGGGRLFPRRLERFQRPFRRTDNDIHILASSTPYFTLTLQASADGVPPSRGRLFVVYQVNLPSAFVARTCLFVCSSQPMRSAE